MPKKRTYWRVRENGQMETATLTRSKARDGGWQPNRVVAKRSARAQGIEYDSGLPVVAAGSTPVAEAPPAPEPPPTPEPSPEPTPEPTPEP